MRFLDVFGYRPLYKHFLQILTVYPCESGPNVDTWYLTPANHQIQRITFNTIDGYSFPNGDLHFLLISNPNLDIFLLLLLVNMSMYPKCYTCILSVNHPVPHLLLSSNKYG